MEITPKTKIAELIKANDKAIDAIAAMAKPFQKLKNPLLRKLLASRVTIQDAAHIGKCTLTDFEKTLSAIGFSCKEFDMQVNPSYEGPPAWVDKLAPELIFTLDVRADIAANNDPLQRILKQLKALKDDQVCCLITPFIPIPLIQLLEKKDYQSYVCPKDADLFYTWIIPKPEALQRQAFEKSCSIQQHLTMHNEETFKDLVNYFGYLQIRYLDVCELPMPEPLHQIMESLSTMCSSEALYVQHRRIPYILLDELADQGYKIHIYESKINDVRLMIQRAGSSIHTKQ